MLTRCSSCGRLIDDDIEDYDLFDEPVQSVQREGDDKYYCEECYDDLYGDLD